MANKTIKSAAAPAPVPARTTGAPKRKVFVVDDHPIVRQGLVGIINGQPDLEVCGQGEDVYQSLAAIRAARPELVLLDVSLKDGDGLELLKEIKSFDEKLLEIADKLILSVKTVEAHRENVKEKLNFKSSAELLRFAIQNSPDAN